MALLYSTLIIRYALDLHPGNHSIRYPGDINSKNLSKPFETLLASFSQFSVHSNEACAAIRILIKMDGLVQVKNITKEVIQRPKEHYFGMFLMGGVFWRVAVVTSGRNLFDLIWPQTYPLRVCQRSSCLLISQFYRLNANGEFSEKTGKIAFLSTDI